MHTIFLIQTYLQGGNKVENKLSLKIVPCNMQVMKGQIKCNLLLGWNPFTERITTLRAKKARKFNYICELCL